MNYKIFIFLLLVYMPCAIPGLHSNFRRQGCRGPIHPGTMHATTAAARESYDREVDRHVKVCNEREERIKNINKRLETFYNDKEDWEATWPERKKIIYDFLENNHDVYPNDIQDCNGVSALYSTVVCEKNESDVYFAKFLFERGALLERGCVPLLAYVRTIPMANLLFAHGHDEQLRAEGPDCLRRIIYNKRASPALIGWCVDRGVDVNCVFYTGETPLLHFVGRCIKFPQECFLPDNARALIEMGALLSIQKRQSPECPEFGGFTVAQIVQATLKFNGDKKDAQAIKITRCMQTLRSIFMHGSHYRKFGLMQDLSLHISVGPICELIARYYIQDEPLYPDLEAVPPSANSQDIGRIKAEHE